MSYNDFWSEFDKRFDPGFYKVDDKGNFITGPDDRPTKLIDKDIYTALVPVMETIDPIFINNFDRLSSKLNLDKFKQGILDSNISENLKLLSKEQLTVIDHHFLNNDSELRNAFEYFGQGALYDINHDKYRTGINPRTLQPQIYRVHMGDGPGIYGRWHSFLRACISLEIHIEAMTKLDRLVGLAYIFHFAAKPIQSFEFQGGDSIEHIPYNQKEEWRQKNMEEIQKWELLISNANPEQLDKILGRSYYNQPPLD